MMRILAVGAHPDDLEIICGGTLAKLVRQGYRVGMIDLTSGEPTPRGSEETRRREAEAARQVLGVPVVNLPIANYDDNQHAADENLRLRNLWDGVELYSALLAGIGKAWGSRTVP